MSTPPRRSPSQRPGPRTSPSAAERPVDLAAVQGTLALDLDHEPLLDPPLTHGRVDVAGDVVSIDTIQRHLLEGWARRYAQAVVEIAAGDRPASQLARWTTPSVYADLNRRAQIVGRAGVHQPGQQRSRSAARAVVRSARIVFVAPGVAEVAVHVRYGERSRALAARFEQARDRWMCSALEFA